MDEFSPLAQKLQAIEAYLNSLVVALQHGELPVNLKNITQVFDQAIGQLPRLNLPREKFIDLYNDLPTILSAYAITATLNAASYRRINSSPIVFDRLHNGNYWILPLAAHPDHAWLVPNPTRRIDLTRLDSLPFAFDWPEQGTASAPIINTFTLTEPAVVHTLPTSPLTWKLLKRGIICPFLPKDAHSPNQTIADRLDVTEMKAMVEQAVDNRLAAMKSQLLSQLRAELQSFSAESDTSAPIEENIQETTTTEVPSLGDLWRQSLTEMMIPGDE
jgi:hypothetical protein